MYENSARLGYSENAIAQLLRDLVEIRKRLAAVEQKPWSDGGGDGGDEARAGYFACTLGSALAHGTSATGQTVWKIDPVGTRTNVTTNGTVYNDGPNAADDIASGKTVILASNADGSYTVIGVYC